MEQIYKTPQKKRDANNESYKKFRVRRLATVKKYNDKRTKVLQRIMHDLKINGCAICGYDKCQDALVFHHANNEDKCFLLRQSCLSHGDEKIIDEINKCVLLCANCHRELHYKERKQMEKDKNENN